MSDQGWGDITVPMAEQVEHLIAERDRYRAERDRLYVELKEAHTWLEAAGLDDCEHRGYEGTKLCRFAEALRALKGPADPTQLEPSGDRSNFRASKLEGPADA